MSCEKLTYNSFFEAQQVVNMANHIGRKPGYRRRSNKKPKRAYKCTICKKFHLTSLKKKHNKVKRRIKI